MTMACMSHHCPTCDIEEMNNIPRMYCPQCGAQMHADFDEWEPPKNDRDDHMDRDDFPHRYDETKDR